MTESLIAVPESHYLELLDFRLNAIRARFDSGKSWDMDEALIEAKKVDRMGYRKDVIEQMENDMSAHAKESRQIFFEERQFQYGYNAPLFV